MKSSVKNLQDCIDAFILKVENFPIRAKVMPKVVRKKENVPEFDLVCVTSACLCLSFVASSCLCSFFFFFSFFLLLLV